MIVKVATMGAEARDYCLGEGAKVTDALTAADVESDGRDIRVNSEPSSLTDELRDGDVVTLVAKVEGVCR